MSTLYRNSVIRFHYPDGWQLEESHDQDSQTISLQSPDAMFLFLTIYPSEVAASDLADRALATMQEEYDALDSDPMEEVIAQCPAVGHDVSFFSLDLTNTCWIRALTLPRHTVLLFAQTNDLCLEVDEKIFQAICGSIELEAQEPRE